MDNKQETMGPIKGAQHSIPLEILDDLSSRFIINVPEEERTNLVRICFQIELAHWFYLDFYCTDETTKVYPCGMKEFSAHIFQHIPFLQKHRPNLENILDHWREYKQSVPTYGAILLNEELTHVMLVQSYWAKASWGFPKGKVNEDEEPWHCACREVLEETGFDITSHINKTDFIESTIHDQIVRLYIIGYIPQSTKFAPRTRNEIKACEWFPIADLPANRKDMTPKLKMGVSPNAFFMVLPFVKRMKRWVAEKTQKNNSNSKRLRHKSMGDLEASTGKTRNNSKIQAFQKDIAELHQTAATAVFQQTSQIIQANGNVFQQTSVFHHSGNAFQPTGNNFQQTSKSFQQSANSFQQPGNSFQSSSFQQPANSFQQTGNVFQSTSSNVLQPSSNNNKQKNNSNQKNASAGKKDKKGNFKRQLFTNSNYLNQPTDKASNTAPAVVDNNSCASNTNYFAKSWMNFKFDRKAIWDSMA